MGFGGGGISNLFLLKSLVGHGGKRGHDDIFTLLLLLDLLKDDHDDDCDDEE